jgi:hypothetical protein
MMEKQRVVMAGESALSGQLTRPGSARACQVPVRAWPLADLSVSSHLAQQNHMEDLP